MSAKGRFYEFFTALELGMTVQHITSDQPTGNSIERYRANYLSEQEGTYTKKEKLL